MIISSTWFTGRWLRDCTHEENMVVCPRQPLRCLIFCLLLSLFWHICGMWWLRFNSTVWVVGWYIKCWEDKGFKHLTFVVWAVLRERECSRAYSLLLAQLAAAPNIWGEAVSSCIILNWLYMLRCETRICLFSIFMPVQYSEGSWQLVEGLDLCADHTGEFRCLFSSS